MNKWTLVLSEKVHLLHLLHSRFFYFAFSHHCKRSLTILQICSPIRTFNWRPVRPMYCNPDVHSIRYTTLQLSQLINSLISNVFLYIPLSKKKKNSLTNFKSLHILYFLHRKKPLIISPLCSLLRALITKQSFNVLTIFGAIGSLLKHTSIFVKPL